MLRRMVRRLLLKCGHTLPGCLSFWRWPEIGEIGMRGGKVDRRLSELERVAALHHHRQQAITVCEWARWRATGETPKRWLSLPAARAFQALAEQRAAAVEVMLAEYEGGGYGPDAAAPESA